MMTNGQVKKIYFFDDSEDEVFLSKMLFEQDEVDLEIIHFNESDEFFEKLKRIESHDCSHPLVVVDLNMPRLRGTEVIRIMRGQKELSGFVAGLCTGSDDPVDRLNALESGADFFVSKPLNKNSLAEICRQVTTLTLLENVTGGCSLSVQKDG